jgi:uncharacterized membrane protein
MLLVRIIALRLWTLWVLKNNKPRANVPISKLRIAVAVALLIGAALAVGALASLHADALGYAQPRYGRL